MEEFWSKEFPITSVTRKDLITAGISKTIVEKHSDDDMAHNASEMENLYCDHSYWEDLRLAFEKIKGEDSG